ncbi:MAG TPA: hypothetical protein PK523_06655, partial [Elusimicrobiales bacterium]|nr:hypothetical protein [Elusimicrobiales bacterium]
IKGFSVFGPLAGPQNVSAAPGNLVLRGNLQADATAYFGSSVTVAGYGVFQSTVQITEGNLKYGSGASGKVLKSGGDGYVYWGDDESGAAALLGTPYRIRMENAAGTGLADSLLLQNAAGTGITLTDSSSMTISGELGVEGYGVFLSTVRFLGNAGVSTNLYFDNAAANVGRVLKASGNGFLYWGTDATGLATLGSPYYLQMVNADGDGLVNSLLLQNAGGTSLTMVSGSSLTVNDMLALGDADIDGKLNVDGTSTFVSSVTALGNTQLGNELTDLHGVNRAPEAGVALSVDSGGDPGDYAAKFYSGGSLAAWIKKK